MLITCLLFQFDLLLDSGHLFTCGDGKFGQLGLGDYLSRSSPVEVSYFSSKHVKQISCGMRHSLALIKGIIVLTKQFILYLFAVAKAKKTVLLLR